MSEVRRTKAYLVVMSNKDPIKIDEEELQKVVEGSAGGAGLIVCKKGVINPSYIVDIQLDKERMREWNDRCQYGHGQGEEYNRKGIEPLTRIYSEGSPIAVLLEKKQVELERLLPQRKKELSTGKVDNNQGEGVQ